jgi:carboxypeptidase T
MKNRIFFHSKKVILIGFCLMLFLPSPFSNSLKTNQFNPVSLDPYDYHTYQELTDELHSLQANHSDIMSLTSIGKTYEGRNIWMVKLSDNVNQEEDEPGVLFMGAHHGNEWPGFEICLFFIRYIVEQYDNDTNLKIRNAVNTTQIFLIPMVNPDGVTADTRKNCVPNHGPFGYNPSVTSYGVNLNRNYDDPWFLAYIFPVQYYLPFILADSSFNYRGPYPFSENETKAVKNFAEAHAISISISYHSYGEFIIYPWTYTTKQTSDEPLFRSIGENISSINHYYLLVKEDRFIPLYGGTLGSSEDWLYREKGTIAYTIEVGAQQRPTNPQVVYNLCMTQTTVHLYVCQRAQTIESEKESIHSS